MQATIKPVLMEKADAKLDMVWHILLLERRSAAIDQPQ
jgi:hypothetical protein